MYVSVSCLLGQLAVVKRLAMKFSLMLWLSYVWTNIPTEASNLSTERSLILKLFLWVNSMVKSTSILKSGLTVLHQRLWEMLHNFLMKINNGQSLMVLSMPFGLKIWTLYLMIIWLFVYLMVNVSNCVHRCACFSRLWIWLLPHLLLYLVVVWSIWLLNNLAGHLLLTHGLKGSSLTPQFLLMMKKFILEKPSEPQSTLVLRRLGQHSTNWSRQIISN